MNADDIAAEILAAADSHRQIAPFTGRAGGLDLDGAYAVTAALRRRRTVRGERTVGRKIGFTNRTIWAEYGVYAPIWGDMYDTTLADLAGSGGAVDVAALAEPRIEPEIAFGLSSAPAPDMDEAALLGCIGWAAHGFEIVQSLFPGWRFAAPDTVAAFGLHGAYRLGPRHAVDAGWLAPLSSFRIALARDGAVVEHGRATDVLDGPLTALRHLVGLLSRDPHNPPLGAGEIVTTGTLTRALPVAPGERWSTVIDGLPIAGIELRIA